MSATVCSRCAEPQVQPSENPLKLCPFCVGELMRAAVGQLAAWQGGGDDALLKRADATEGLRQLGSSSQQVLRARARAFDGHPVEEIVKELRGEAVEAVAA